MKPKTKILIIEENPLFQRALKRMLEFSGWIEASEASRSNYLIETILMTSLDFIILSLDQSSWQKDKLLVKEIIAKKPGVSVLVLSDDFSEDLVFAFYNSGAADVLDKTCDEKVLLDHIRRIQKGEHVFNDEFRKIFAKKEAGRKELMGLLSGRELEVARLWSAFISAKEIAVQLDITENTVKTHKRSIYTKTATNSRTGLSEFMKKFNLQQ